MYSIRCQAHLPLFRPARTRRSNGFSLVEALVAVGCVAVLAALLFPAYLAVVRTSQEATTRRTMQHFVAACDAYFDEFGEYPAAIPDVALEAIISPDDEVAPPISSTENVLLALMGGYRVPGDSDYSSYGGTVLTFPTSPPFVIKINPSKVGEGPYREGRLHAPYYKPLGGELGYVCGQISGTGVEGQPFLPDLLDAWNMPILCLRQAQPIGLLVRTIVDGSQTQRQFSRAGLLPYTLSNALGESGTPQLLESARASYSLFNTTRVGHVAPICARDFTVAQIVRHPGYEQAQTSGNDIARVCAGLPRGRVVLISAGSDRIYFAATQGYGQPGQPQSDIVSASTNPEGAQVVRRFDDIVAASAR